MHSARVGVRRDRFHLEGPSSPGALRQMRIKGVEEFGWESNPVRLARGSSFRGRAACASSRSPRPLKQRWNGGCTGLAAGGAGQRSRQHLRLSVLVLAEALVVQGTRRARRGLGRGIGGTHRAYRRAFFQHPVVSSHSFPAVTPFLAPGLASSILFLGSEMRGDHIPWDWLPAGKSYGQSPFERRSRSECRERHTDLGNCIKGGSHMAMKQCVATSSRPHVAVI